MRQIIVSVAAAINARLRHDKISVNGLLKAMNRASLKLVGTNVVGKLSLMACEVLNNWPSVPVHFQFSS